MYLLNPIVFSEDDFVAVNTLQSDNRENLCSASTPDVTVTYICLNKKITLVLKTQLLLFSTNSYASGIVSSLPVTIEAVSPLAAMGPQT
jgi:hypothetical protein